MTPGLLIFLCASVGGSSTTPFTTTTTTTTPRPPPVQLLIQAVPDYPVTTQPVLLTCVSNVSVPGTITWIWERQIVEAGGITWREEGTASELTVSTPDQSGTYRCRAHSPNREFNDSIPHQVSIVDTHRTDIDNLGIASFVFSILALVLIIAVVVWLLCQKSKNTTWTVPITKTDPPSAPKPKDVEPPVASDPDIYMNYSSSKQSYADLDPNNMNEDAVYSSLS